METKYNFALMSISEFEIWIANLRVGRTVIYLQQHHTYNPNYSLFDGSNHFELQKGMRNHHINANGWADIGQHFTIFPDGTIMTGRSIENSPACIYMNNANSICIENLGNFDTSGDVMTAAQRDAIIKASAAICLKFSIPVNTDKIVYHHWYKLSDGVRNNGSGGNKSCPGTNFFGGNKVADCEQHFLPLLRNAMGTATNPQTAVILKYVCVTANTLNVRSQSNGNAAKVTDRPPATLGAILRVYQEQNGWYKISGSKQHWVSGSHAIEVKRATVNVDVLNVRNQPTHTGLKLGAEMKGQEVFVFEEANGWSKIGLEDRWVKSQYLTF
jgi:hypothetical protein